MDSVLAQCACGVNSDTGTWSFCSGCHSWFHVDCSVGLDASNVRIFNHSSLCNHCKVTNSTQTSSQVHDSNLLSCPQCPENSLKKYKGIRGLRIHMGKVHGNITQTSLFSLNQNCESFQSRLCLFKRKVRTLRRIPKGARSCAAERLTSIINNCITKNDSDSWQELLIFSYIALQIPSSRSTDISLTSVVKQNIYNFNCNVIVSDVEFKRSDIVKQLEAKVADGDLKGAVKLLASDTSLAPKDEKTYHQLLLKHPCPSRDLNFPQPPEENSICLRASEEMVLQAIYSFPCGSAPGLDGLRPQHLKDLLSSSAGDNGPKLLCALTKLCNHMLSGKVPQDMCPFLYGANLCALNKKDNSIRPIAVGNTFRRLAAKICCSSVKDELVSYLYPKQLGFAVKRGCEAAIHSTRSFLFNNLNTDKVVVKIDLKNAFNSVERDSLLLAVKEKAKTLYPFLWQCYAEKSLLFFDQFTIESQVGAQQGDPLGPLIFSLSIHEIVKKLKSELNIWYLDDGTLGGSPDVVLEDIKTLVDSFKEIGLTFNTEKCEIFYCSENNLKNEFSNFNLVLPNIKYLCKKKFTILGAPIFTEGITDYLENKLKTVCSFYPKFQNLHSHVAYVILKSCFAIPKFIYLIRTTPSWLFPNIVNKIDNCFRECLEQILNISLDNIQWTQASLPIKFGGLSVRRLSDVGLPAFLASTFGVSDTVTTILNNTGDTSDIPYVDEALKRWNSLVGPDNEPPVDKSVQKLWDLPLIKKSLSVHFSECSTKDSARLKAVSTPESGLWLQVIPSSKIGTLLDDTSFRVATALRLGCKICEPHKCICGDMVDEKGHHGLSCLYSSGRFSRHTAINSILKKALNSANYPSILEPPGLYRNDGKRPDGLTLLPWSRGRSLVWDATCADTLAPSHIQITSMSAGGAAEVVARAKHSKYISISATYEFLAFSVETLGSWSAEAKAFTKRLGKELRKVSGDPRAGNFFCQSVSLAIQRGNTASVLGTLRSHSGPELNEIFYINR